MQTYVVRRPGIASTAAELDVALIRLRAFEDEPGPADARWIHSYALREADDRFGLTCVFRADGTQTLQKHAELTRLPALEMLPIAATVNVRPFAPTMVWLVRRRNFWRTPADLEKTVAVCRRVEKEMPHQVSWLRSYAVKEDDGTLGTVCLYQSVGTDALRRHAARVGMPADEIVPVMGRIVFRGEQLSPFVDVAA